MMMQRSAECETAAILLCVTLPLPALPLTLAVITLVTLASVSLASVFLLAFLSAAVSTLGFSAAASADALCWTRVFGPLCHSCVNPLRNRCRFRDGFGWSSCESLRFAIELGHLVWSRRKGSDAPTGQTVFVCRAVSGLSSPSVCLL